MATAEATVEELDVYCRNTLPVLEAFSRQRHAPAWLLEPGWSPALPGESTGAGLTKGTFSVVLLGGTHRCMP